MPEIESISQIQIGEQIFDIDVVTVGGKSAKEIGNLITSIDDGSSDLDMNYLSAKYLYDVIYGTNYVNTFLG